ncbi:Putative multidrug resistance protein mdtD [Actinoplanes sp. SE50]|uniref:MFS transporter n=1 Tax=unclassified Actinoplanes TaxID=2626549 RepID=UPI00023EC0CB|nr:MULTISPECIES: MFS transporter [unclassified Actinoplanes]AEV84068.1 Putative multidrug resistance protein mdtD [Actinoplanes sp. SE50/110]ATO82460.1 Putative multidrug resistance protein mdtD [Actinoplanes sp. SE50]SLL99867.1 Putative multidrug resistance protein mdtD [Actinoplanes sp. SE50/110]
MRNRSNAPLVVYLCAAFTTLLDQASLTTALPALRGTLGAGPATLQWIIAGYSLTFGLALVPAGRLGDAHGRRRLFAGGVALFTMAAIVGGTATAPWVVAIARLAQGAGAGTVNPQVYGIIQDLYTGRARTRALGAYATVGGIAGVIGPPLGGLVLNAAGEHLGWRLILLFTVPFGLTTVPLAILLLPRGRAPQAARTTLDLPGLGLLAVTTLGLLLPFTLPAGSGPPRAVWALAAGAALLALIAWERRYARRGRTPVLIPDLLRRPGFSLGTLTAMFQFGASLATTLVLVLHLQDGLGWSPLRAALTTLPSALGFAVASAQSWRLVTRYGRPSVTAALTGAGPVDRGHHPGAAHPVRRRAGRRTGRHPTGHGRHRRAGRLAEPGAHPGRRARRGGRAGRGVPAGLAADLGHVRDRRGDRRAERPHRAPAVPGHDGRRGRDVRPRQSPACDAGNHRQISI